MPQITQLDNDPTPNNNDLLVIVDMAAGKTKNITRGDLLKAPLPSDSVIVAGLSSGATISVTSTSSNMMTAQKISLERTTIQKGGLTLSDGDILIGSNIDNISVSAQVYFTEDVNTTGNYRVAVLNVTKGEIIVRTITRLSGQFEMFNTPYASSPVSPGDIIRLTVSATNTGATIGNNLYDTMLTVRSI